MLIKTLVENTALSPFYECQHGLSFYVETKKHKILIDLGKDDMFYENAQKLDVDIDSIDTVIITHGHYDHGGGIAAFLEHNHHAKIYVHKLAFEDYYSLNGGKLRYIGLDKTYKDHPQVCLLDSDVMLDDEIQIFSSVYERNYCASSNFALKVKRNEKYDNDLFLHEQNVIISDGTRKFLFSGCAHCGIINILNRAERLCECEMDAAFSGFHLTNPSNGKLANLRLIEITGDLLAKKKTRYFTGHCTGQIPYEVLKTNMKSQIDYVSAGTCLIL